MLPLAQVSDDGLHSEPRGTGLEPDWGAAKVVVARARRATRIVECISIFFEEFWSRWMGFEV